MLLVSSMFNIWLRSFGCKSVCMRAEVIISWPKVSEGHSIASEHLKGTTQWSNRKCQTFYDVVWILNYASVIKSWPEQNLMYFLVSFCSDQHVQRRKSKCLLLRRSETMRLPTEIHLSVIWFLSSVCIPQHVITGRASNTERLLCLSFLLFDGHAFIHPPSNRSFDVQHFGSCWWGNVSFLHRSMMKMSRHKFKKATRVSDSR